MKIATSKLLDASSMVVRALALFLLSLVLLVPWGKAESGGIRLIGGHIGYSVGQPDSPQRGLVLCQGSCRLWLVSHVKVSRLCPEALGIGSLFDNGGTLDSATAGTAVFCNGRDAYYESHYRCGRLRPCTSM